MPIARVQMPDGRIARLEVPDGTTPEQVESFAFNQVNAKAPDPTGSFGENFLAGAGKAFTDLGRGARQIAAKVGIGDEKDVQEDVDEARRLDAPLMKTGGGITGNIVGLTAAAVPTAFIPGANTYTGAALTGAALGALQPTKEDESRLLNTGMGAGFGVAGKYVGGKVANVVTERLSAKTAEKAAQATQNATRDATLSAGRQAGYVVPPTQANPQSAWNQILEGFSGKIKTGQAASVKNQEVTNRLAKQALGLADDVPITKTALKAIRDQAGQAYDDIASVSQYATDSTFVKRIGQLAASQKTLEAEVPEIASKEVLKLAESLNRPSFSGNTAVELTKTLREKASQAFRTGDTGAARFYRGAASEVEDLIERNLMQSGQGSQMLNAFRSARQAIAKSYTVENALNESTGNVVGSKLAQQLAKGKPLSGTLDTAAKFARAFPKAAQEIEGKGAALATSPLDWAAYGTIGALMQNPAVLAGVAARPVARSLILSSPYQAAMTNPQYTIGSLMRGSKVLANPQLQRLLPGLATGAGLTYSE